MKRPLTQKRSTLMLALWTAGAVMAAASVLADSPPPTIDPTTGLPVEEWKTEDWKDPDRRLATVTYEGLPLGEVVRHLRDEFKNAFDVLLPRAWQDPGDPTRSVAPDNLTVTMQLKNVSASEIFNAMNLMFETENAPVRWRLTMNGQRPTVLLRVLPGLVPAQPAPPPREQPRRMVYFVGNLIGDPKSGSMTMDQLVKTVNEIYLMSYGKPTDSLPFDKNALQFHTEAQLLILTGTIDQIQFMQEALTALRRKVELDHQLRAQAADAKTKTEEPKTR